MPAQFTKRSPLSAVDAVVNLPDAATAIGVSIFTLKRLDDRKQIKIIRLSPRRLGIRMSEISRFLENCEARGSYRVQRALTKTPGMGPGGS